MEIDSRPQLARRLMGLVTFLGTILLGFGPVLALNTLVVFRRSQLLVIEISRCVSALATTAFPASPAL